MNLIKGAGGGGGKGGGGGSTHVPSEERDSLQSKSYAQVLDAVSEGEIEGLVDGHKSIYFDGTPLQNKDGSYNFSNVTISTRPGSQEQDYIAGFSAVESEAAVGLTVRKDYPITKTIINSNANAARVTIAIPQLTYQNPSTGDLAGSEVSFSIEIQANGGGFQEYLRDTIIGKCVSKYIKSYRVELSGTGPWDIRVRRLSADSASVTTQNNLQWESYTEIVDAKMKYPNTALVGIRIDASQFSNIPQRAYELKLLRVKIPTNYNPKTRQYTGAWDGSFYIAWTDNPAWIFYDLITSNRYGLGDLIPSSHVDKWSLYTIAKYCDELVSDGFGGLEPRFTANLYIQSQEEAFKVINDLASIFRAMVYWANGSIVAVQDAPDDAAFLFSPANVVDGLFTYSGSSAKTRHTVCLVGWNDPQDSYQQKIEYVEDSAAVAKHGILETSVTAFGCTSRGQAHRVGKWLLYTEQNQTETVTFKTGLNGSVARPGQIIKIADPTRAGGRYGGRVLSSTTTEIKTDQPLNLLANGFTVSVVLPNGSIEERPVISINGDTITVLAPFSVAPAQHSLWMLSSANIEPQFFKIVAIVEGDGGVHEITAIAHNPQKYDHIENDLILEPRKISTTSVTPDAPQGLTITETLYTVDSEVRVKATISWDSTPGAIRYLVQYQKESGNPSPALEQTGTDFEILNIEPGTYTARVQAINSLGKKSLPSSVTNKIIGKTLPPGDIENFSLIPSNGMALLSWTKSSDLDVLFGGSVRIRHTPNILDPQWKNSVDIAQMLAGSSTQAYVPLLPGCYLAKFVDSSGVPSITEARIITTIPQPLALNVVKTITENTWAGAKDKMEIFEDYGGIALKASMTIDSIEENLDDLENFDFAGGVATSGTYDLSEIVDLSQIFSSRVTAIIDAESVDVADTIDLRMDLCDDWSDLDGNLIDDVNAEIYLSTTLDDPALPSAIWSEWKRFVVADYAARAFKFQLRATSKSKTHNIIVKSISMVVDMPDRVFSATLTSGAQTHQVTYDGAFVECPRIGLTISNPASGDYHQITDEQRTGFKVTFYNSLGQVVSRSFSVLAKGFGREL